MICTIFENYCADCPYIDVEVETKIQVDKNDKPIMTTTRITCKNIDICRRIAKQEKG